MTREEAIETLKANYPDACFEQLREAVDTAISALQAQDVPETNDGDMISRKAAIDAAISADMENHSGILSEKRARVIDRHISAVPSAQPDGIPLKWIDKHLKWLDNCDNGFAQLAKVGIRAMVEIWKKDKT